MHIQFRQGSEALSQKSIDKAQVKIEKLGRFITERNYEAEVHVDVERESGATNSESMWRASLHIDLGGERFNAEAKRSTAEKAVDVAILEMKREVRSAGAKKETVQRKSGSTLKRLIRMQAQ